MLNRLEPVDGDNIHKTYLEEQQNYQSMLDNLMNDKEQKTSHEAVLEVDQLISQLDQKHQERLKEILGTHYEAIRDHYEEYLETSLREYLPNFLHFHFLKLPHLMVLMAKSLALRIFYACYP